MLKISVWMCICVCVCFFFFFFFLKVACTRVFGLYWTYRLKRHRHWPFFAPAGPPLSITSRGWLQLFNFSTVSDVRLLLVLLTRNRYCPSPRFSAILLFFSQLLHNGCDGTADRGRVFLRL